MLVRDVLESKGRRVISIDSEATVSEAVAKLVQNNIGSLPVSRRDGSLMGIFSERDVLRMIHNRGEGFGRLRICDVMTRKPVTCSPRRRRQRRHGQDERAAHRQGPGHDRRASSSASSRSGTSSRSSTTRSTPKTSI